MHKRAGILALLLSTTMLFTGCNNNADITELKSIEALGGESQINNVSLSINEK